MRSEAEGHRCELNNSTHEGNENDLEENPDYEYRGTRVRMVSRTLLFFGYFKLSKNIKQTAVINITRQRML